MTGKEILGVEWNGFLILFQETEAIPRSSINLLQFLGQNGYKKEIGDRQNKKDCDQLR
jgi:hypothetical protein